MADRTTEEIRALGKAAGLNINDQDLREVTFVLNSILTSLEKVNCLVSMFLVQMVHMIYINYSPMIT